MTLEITLLLVALFIKHWYVDFVNQTYAEIVSKRVYGEWLGLYHSVKHGLGTVLCVMFINPVLAIVVGILEVLIHYHIDWIKMNYGESDQSNKLFWTHFGLDQLAHALTYIGIVWLVVQAGF